MDGSEPMRSRQLAALVDEDATAIWSGGRNTGSRSFSVKIDEFVLDDVVEVEFLEADSRQKLTKTMVNDQDGLLGRESNF